MNPMAIAAGAAGAAFLGYLGYKKFKTPSYQTVTTMGLGGVPLTIATPVSDAVSVSQATATPYAPLSQGPILPVGTNVPGVGMVYAPPGSITAAPNGGVMQPAPIVVSPTGVSSVAIGTTKDVQHALNTLGYASPPLTEDGILGPITIAAIKSFQSKNGLVVDGNAGPATKAALSASLMAVAAGGSVIGQIVQTQNVTTGVIQTANGPINTTGGLSMTLREAQKVLNLLGASPPLTEDGIVGPKTTAALKSFQTSHGLTSDGILGPKTKTALSLAYMALPKVAPAIGTPQGPTNPAAFTPPKFP